jgi:hypothetical protein
MESLYPWLIFYDNRGGPHQPKGYLEIFRARGSGNHVVKQRRPALGIIWTACSGTHQFFQMSQMCIQCILIAPLLVQNKVSRFTPLPVKCVINAAVILVPGYPGKVLGCLGKFVLGAWFDSYVKNACDH